MTRYSDNFGADVERTMLANYLQTALRKANYEILSDVGSFYGEISGFEGVYANAERLEECRNELEEVLEEDPVPCIENPPTPSRRWH